LPDILSSARLLAHGARKDIERLDIAFSDYFAAKPYGPFTEKDVKTGLYTHGLKISTNLPELLSRDAARIASDLRSALDQAGYATAVASGNTRLKYTYFPFSSDVAQMDNVVKSRCKDLPQDIIALFRTFKAYRGGNDLLWSVNEIANGVKHRFIVPVGQYIAGGEIKHFTGSGNMSFPPVWDRAKDEIVLCSSVMEGARIDYDIKLEFLVTFGNVEVVRGKPVIVVLKALNNMVDVIIKSTEAEARRIGLIT
jgi:hypothetical protein